MMVESFSVQRDVEIGIGRMEIGDVLDQQGLLAEGGTVIDKEFLSEQSEDMVRYFMRVVDRSDWWSLFFDVDDHVKVKLLLHHVRFCWLDA